MRPCLCIQVHNNTSHGVFAKDIQLRARLTQLDTDRHATATPLCGPTRYDLHLRDGRVRKRTTRAKKRKERPTEGERRGQERLLFVCADLACFSLVLNFDRLRLLLGSVSLLSHGQGRRDDTTSLGTGGEGLRVLKGVGGREVGGRLELTEGYKYLWQPDDHTVSQLESDGRALAGHLATLTP